ncbi:MAG: bifunctional D-glycero-beta-D-manno-heptose-7-phosphate kinase/D-glycero-beta-D-manno-heptose 1-phosphate adenylyltransferase HldE [Gammaproteobacteria bacterium]|nr:bifunctional D-glycero-beta-D-manno-heptose-7-phosphate kinase/D-glycero-beta-D-manno-heptose 1-phosphate adenylyltransferase HldE [Gammaproteobacteria bacterium]
MLQRFVANSGARIVVIGDVILDRYVHGTTTRISPEAPVPVVRVESTEERPGGAANVAMNIRALGIRPQLAGITGDDTAADLLAQRLADAGVDCRFVRQAGFPTVTKLRVVSQHQQLLRLDYEREPAAANGDDLHARFGELLPGADCVILSDYAKGSLQHVGDLIGAARAASIPVLVDPKADDFSRYHGATLLTPNQKEFEIAAGPCRDAAEMLAKGRDICRGLALQALVVTQGERGMTLIRAEGDARHHAARAREVFDVTGAGDTVIATLGAALVSGYGLEAALHFANVAAGIVVGKLGAVPVSARELNESLAALEPARRGVLTPAEALVEVATARERGERVVMTNGCFDLLHDGHVQFLEEARSLGDRLLVAINDDASVSRLKGRGRPVNSLQQRSRVLAALTAVDWVVGFPEDTPANLIEKLRPDVLVKGGDYSPDQIAGADCVRSSGGEIVVLPLLKGRSTSGTIEAIRVAAGKDSG